MVVALLNILIVALIVILSISFGGYYLLLRVLARFKTVEHKADPDFSPTVTLLIVAFNEEKTLKAKLENSLELEYPAELLDIIVVSDGSTDGTDEIVRQFSDRQIKLIVNPVNTGKAGGINLGMDNIDSDIVVMSDANVMYKSDSIRKLVRHFADPSIGAVSGKVVLLSDGLSYSAGENTYYDVEHRIQQLESTTGDLIGADGAMYALRRSLVRPLELDTLLDDFVLSLGVVQLGKRLIFDAEACGFEQNLAELDTEYNRKVRIIAGGIQSLKRRTVWPPKGQRLTALKLICHKVLRWVVGPVLLLLLTLLAVRLGLAGYAFLALLLVASLPASVVILKYFPNLLKFKLVGIYNYLITMMKASIEGCYKGLRDQRVSWR